MFTRGQLFNWAIGLFQRAIVHLSALGGIPAVANRLIAVLPRIATYLVVVFFGLVVYRSLSEKKIVIEPFEVPTSLQSQGYSGRVVANRLMSALMQFRNDVATRPGLLSDFRTDFRTVELDIEVEAAGFSSKKVTQVIAYAFGISPARVSGEVTIVAEKLELTIRVGQETVATNGSSDDLDSLTRAVVPGIIKAVEPYFFAWQVAETDPKACLAVVQDLIGSKDATWMPWAYNLWGIVLDKEGRFEEAREKFRKALTFHGSLFYRAMTRNAYAAANNNLGVSFARERKNERAVEHFRKAIKLKPDYADALINLAEVSDQAGDHDEALAQYTKAIELTPSRADLYHKRGLVHRKRDPSKAVADLRFSRRLDGSNLEVLWDLGIALKQHGECPEAARVFHDYMQANGKHSEKAKIYELDCVYSLEGEHSNR